jgi:hypothetical protein
MLLRLTPGRSPSHGIFSQHLAGARLGNLALALADRSELRVCVITYEDGTCELQILYTGLPRPAGIADAATFTGPARAALGQIRSIAGDSDLQAAADLIYATLRDTDASAC